jgi:hypothetical protein
MSGEKKLCLGSRTRSYKKEDEPLLNLTGAMSRCSREKEYRGLSPNFHIHVSVSELYIPTMGLPVLLEEICRLILGIYKSLKDS